MSTRLRDMMKKICCEDKEYILFINDLKKIFETANINVLLGSGFSANILKTLGNLESFTTKLKQTYLETSAINYVKYKFFKESIFPLTSMNTAQIATQIEFVSILERLILKRGNPSVDKRVNIFTTNYDDIIELSLEENNIFYNDGFINKINPIFSTANFGYKFSKQAIFSSKEIEIPFINLIKLHGSLTWQNQSEEIIYNWHYKNDIENIEKKFSGNFETKTMEVIDECIIKDDYNNSQLNFIEDNTQEFITAYNNFMIVFPSKDKFESTVMNLQYHEMLRIFSNELEKNQTLLLVFGFSFSDEHILEITRRSLTNPSLIICIFCYDDFSKNEISKKFFKSKFNSNIILIYSNYPFDLRRLNDMLNTITKIEK